MVEINKKRPYWHVDMKWIVSFLLLFMLGITLFVFQLYKLTSPKVAIETGTLLVATMFSGGNLDKTDDLEEAKRKFPPDVNGNIHPLPASPTVSIPATDLDKLPPRELRLKIFKQIVEPIYYRGSGKEYASTLSDQDAMKQLGAMAFLTEKTHIKIKNILLLFGFICLALLILLIKFSYGLGRLVSPAIIFILVSLPGIFFAIVFSAQGGKKPPSFGGDNGYGQMIAQVATTIGPTISKQFAYVYIPLLCLGLVLLIVALVLKIFKKGKQSVSVS